MRDPGYRHPRKQRRSLNDNGFRGGVGAPDATQCKSLKARKGRHVEVVVRGYGEVEEYILPLVRVRLYDFHELLRLGRVFRLEEKTERVIPCA
jgi:hypothetical protein